MKMKITFYDSMIPESLLDVDIHIVAAVEAECNSD